jgi:hypothetical protein
VTTASRKFDRPPLKAPLDELIVRLDSGADPRAASQVVRTLVDRIHGGAGDFDLVVPETLLEQSRRTQRLFSIVMGCIASISLLVGGIGIMNIMLATVLERTREIGVRRAVGARRLDIRNQFIIESFSISALGGVLGISVGLLIARAVAAYAGWPTVVTLASIALSTGSRSRGPGVGIYPAVRAAGSIRSTRFDTNRGAIGPRRTRRACAKTDRSFRHVAGRSLRRTAARIGTGVLCRLRTGGDSWRTRRGRGFEAHDEARASRRSEARVRRDGGRCFHHIISSRLSNS